MYYINSLHFQIWSLDLFHRIVQRLPNGIEGLFLRASEMQLPKNMTTPNLDLAPRDNFNENISMPKHRVYSDRRKIDSLIRKVGDFVQSGEITKAQRMLRDLNLSKIPMKSDMLWRSFAAEQI